MDFPQEVVKPQKLRDLNFLALKREHFRELFGISEEGMTTLEHSGIVRRFEKGPMAGNFDFVSSVRNFLSQYKNMPVTSSFKEFEDEEDEDRAYRRERRRKAKVEADLAEKLVVAIVDVEKTAANEIIRAKARLLNLPMIVASEINPYVIDLSNGHDIVRMVRERAMDLVNEALAELSRVDTDEDEQDVE